MKKLLTGTLLMVVSGAATGACEYIIYPYSASASGAIGTHRLSSPSDGIGSNWRGTAANDAQNGLLPGLSTSIDISSNHTFQPPGTILSSAGGIPYTVFAHRGGYDPEQVFFRCTPDTVGQLFEAWSTNGDDAYGGMYEATDVPNAYLTLAKNVALRLTHEETGLPFRSEWQQRAMTNLDTDANGNFLIKAKNFSPIRAELIKTADERYYANTAASFNYNAVVTPTGYQVFRGPGTLSWSIKIGEKHYGGNWSGWPNDWPGIVSLYSNGIVVRRSAICQIQDFTPLVLFTKITVAELNAGASRSTNFTLNFACESAVVSGVATNKNNVALGFLAPASSVAAARGFNLVSGSAVTWLLDENYGEAGHAKGVGVRIYRNGSPMNFLTTDTSGTGSAGGWTPVFAGAPSLTSSQNGVNYYQETFEARLGSFGADALSAGTYQSHAQILLRLQ
ncbi:fimbrial protein [Atlantibacter sp.]|uniref:fimbrial protein n=1 Tax=Atlantibacter sp. TaxID=1903473 RepID=UPI0028B09C56|nr:fimbrial protein [Atlantibacter sp.]